MICMYVHSCLICLMFYHFLYLQSLYLDISNVVAAVEKSFPTSLVSPDKNTKDCNKAFLEDERDMSIKTGEVNVVLDSGRNRRSARMRNVKLYQKKQPSTGDPATHPDKDHISASAALEMSDGGQESLLTPIQSQKGRVNTLSVQVNVQVTFTTASSSYNTYFLPSRKCASDVFQHRW